MVMKGLNFIYLLCLSSQDEGGLSPLLAFDEEFAALDERARRIQNPDVLEAIISLNARYVVLPVQKKEK